MNASVIRSSKTEQELMPVKFKAVYFCPGCYKSFVACQLLESQDKICPRCGHVLETWGVSASPGRKDW